MGGSMGRPARFLVMLAAMMLSLLAMAAGAWAATPTLTLESTTQTITAGAQITLTATTDVPGAQLTLSRMRADESAFVALNTGTACAGGTLVWTKTPAANTVYRVEYAGGDVWEPAAAELAIAVKPRLTLTANASVYRDKVVTFRAGVTPAHPGATMELQRRVEGVWTAWQTVTLGDDSTGTYRWKSDKIGTFEFRLHMAADADHAQGFSAKTTVKVRNPNPYRVPASLPRIIVVDKSEYRLYYHEYGRIVKVFPCVLGKPSTPTPLGRFRIYAKDSNTSGPYGPRRMRYMGAYAVHGTNQPSLLTHFPRAYSHGCTRLSNTNVLWLFSKCRVGTPVWNVK
jgi:lipoprotein-anchoring transpeptidase ErfK/SrfK